MVETTGGLLYGLQPGLEPGRNKTGDLRRKRREQSQATYYGANGDEIFPRSQVWVRIADEIIDGNVDCLAENPVVPSVVSIAPYWGPLSEVPEDGRLREMPGAVLPSDPDVEGIWWPELRQWVGKKMSG
jgi:hypothetical protein